MISLKVHFQGLVFLLKKKKVYRFFSADLTSETHPVPSRIVSSVRFSMWVLFRVEPGLPQARRGPFWAQPRGQVSAGYGPETAVPREPSSERPPLLDDGFAGSPHEKDCLGFSAAHHALSADTALEPWVTATAHRLPSTASPYLPCLPGEELGTLVLARQSWECGMD